MATKTLAEIYLKQGHLREAYEILRALAEKDPSDREVQERLKELAEKAAAEASSADEKVRILKGWLANIQERRRR